MKLFNRYNIERNFPRGVYLSPLGDIPSLDIVADKVVYSGDLFIPVPSKANMPAEIKVTEGDSVESGDILAMGLSLVKSPCDGTVASICSCYVRGFGESPAICINPRAGYRPGLYKGYGQRSILPEQSQPQQILKHIREAGVYCSDGRILADLLEELLKRSVHVIIANAVAPEPIMNTPAAILSAYPTQVYAGLSILRHLLKARRAILTFPHKMEPDIEVADIWQVEQVSVSEKYPQYHPQALAQTLLRQKRISKAESSKLVVFDIQTLALVERAVMAERAATERVVTVAGDAVSRPGHYLVPVGLAVSDLLEIAGVESYECVVAGRSLTGVTVDPVRSVVSPFCEGYTVFNSVSINNPDRCNRCGRCIEFCPRCLDPAMLIYLIETGKYSQAVKYGLYDCYECGLCGYCCSSGLKILESIRMAKKILDDSASR